MLRNHGWLIKTRQTESATNSVSMARPPRRQRCAAMIALVCVCLLGGCARAAPDKGEIQDYYARLGIPPTASQKEIKQAYHRMSIKCVRA